jgi:glycerophosphoryl diester phosphodiesterase
MIMTKPLLFAHRGLSSQAPENTMAAFKLAVQRRFDGIETDAHLTADGKLALIHDENTRRTAGVGGKVVDLTMADLKKLDAGSWYDDAFAGESIPEFWQLLELVKPSSLIINLELKNNVCRYPGLEQAVLSELKRFEMLDRVLFSSFNHSSMALVKELEPKVETALLYSNILHRTAKYVQMCKADGIHPQHHSVDRSLVEECHRAGLKVRPWTVDNSADAEIMSAFGVDALVSNCPDELFTTNE